MKTGNGKDFKTNARILWRKHNVRKIHNRMVAVGNYWGNFKLRVKYLRNVPVAYSVEQKIALGVPQVPKSLEHAFFYHCSTFV
jgi:hypothetical protein